MTENEISKVKRSLQCNSPGRFQATRIFGAGVVAERVQSVELAPAVGRHGPLKAGASSTHSIRFGRFGGGLAALRLCSAISKHRRGLRRFFNAEDAKVFAEERREKETRIVDSSDCA